MRKKLNLLNALKLFGLTPEAVCGSPKGGGCALCWLWLAQGCWLWLGWLCCAVCDAGGAQASLVEVVQTTACPVSTGQKRAWTVDGTEADFLRKRRMLLAGQSGLDVTHLDTTLLVSFSCPMLCGEARSAHTAGDLVVCWCALTNFKCWCM